MAVRIPDKPAGARHTVTMYDPDQAPHGIVMGLIRGGKAPLPALPPGCTCCDAPTERRQPLTLSSDRYDVEPMAVPVCETCRDHAFAETLATHLIGWSAVLCLAGIAIGLGLDAVALTFVSGLLALFALAIAAFRAHFRRARLRDGHHPLAVHMTPGKTVVKTTNRRVVAGVVELNPRSVKYVT